MKKKILLILGIVSLLLLSSLVIAKEKYKEKDNSDYYGLKQEYLDALETINLSNFTVSQEFTNYLNETIMVCITKENAINKCDLFNVYVEELTNETEYCYDYEFINKKNQTIIKQECLMIHEVDYETLKDAGYITKVYKTDEWVQKKIDKWVEKTLTRIAKATIKRNE